MAKKEKEVDNITAKLRFLELARGFDVTRNSGDDGYDIQEKDGTMVALIVEGDAIEDVRYFISGVYNSGSEFAEIDMYELTRLKEFCELLMKEGK